MRHRIAVLVTAGAAATVVATLAACGSTELVCQGPKQHVTVLPFTSPSDVVVSRELAPRVADQVAAEVAGSCGSVATGIVDGSPGAHLVITAHELDTREDVRVPNRKPFVRKMEREIRSFLEERMLTPLEETDPSPGSPFLGTLAKVSQETVDHQRPRGTVILIGDSIARERTPSGERLDFRQPVPAERLEEFVPLLSGLAGHCVLLIGQGGVGGPRPPDDTTLRAAREMLARTLDEVGAGFASTRSSDLPPDCGRGTSSEVADP